MIIGPSTGIRYQATLPLFFLGMLIVFVSAAVYHRLAYFVPAYSITI